MSNREGCTFWVFVIKVTHQPVDRDVFRNGNGGFTFIITPGQLEHMMGMSWITKGLDINNIF